MIISKGNTLRAAWLLAFPGFGANNTKKPLQDIKLLYQSKIPISAQKWDSPPNQSAKCCIPAFQEHVLLLGSSIQFLPLFQTINFLAVPPSDFSNQKILTLQARLFHSEYIGLEDIPRDCFELYGPLSSQGRIYHPSLQRQYSLTELIKIKEELIIEISTLQMVIIFLENIQYLLLQNRKKRLSKFIKLFNISINAQKDSYKIKLSKLDGNEEKLVQWEKIGLNLETDRSSDVMFFFLQLCKVEDLISLIRKSRNNKLFGKGQEEMTVQFYKRVRENDDGSFINFMIEEGLYIPLINRNKIRRRSPIYQPMRRERRKMCQDVIDDHEFRSKRDMTVIYEEDKQNIENLTQCESPPKLSCLHRTISELVQNRQKQYYMSSKRKLLLKMNVGLEGKIYYD